MTPGLRFWEGLARDCFPLRIDMGSGRAAKLNIFVLDYAVGDHKALRNQMEQQVGFEPLLKRRVRACIAGLHKLCT